MTFGSPDWEFRHTEGRRFACVLCNMFTWGEPKRETTEDSREFVCEACILHYRPPECEEHRSAEVVALRVVPRSDPPSETHILQEQVA